MSKKNPAPKWLLNDSYGCSTDAHNWILHKRFGKNWKPIGYYATPEKLLAGLYRKMCRCETTDLDLIAHVASISKGVQAVAARLSAFCACH